MADEETCERLEVTFSQHDPDLTSDDSAKTADGQATHAVDVWFTTGWGSGRAYGVERNGYGQRKWYRFRFNEEARTWFEQVTIDHS